MNGKSVFKLIAVVLLAAALTAGLCAQAGQGRGRMTGKVMDETGKPLANVAISLQFDNSGKKFETTTNAKGEWSLIGLGSGHATLIVVADGYLPKSVDANVSQLNRNPPVETVLQVDVEKKARIKDETAMNQLDQGGSLFEQRKFQEALAVFNQFLTDNPGVYHIHLNIGDCYREMQDFPTAVAEYQKALEKAQAAQDKVIEAKSLASIGEVHLRQNDMKSAGEFFKKSLDLNPKDELLAYNVATIFFNNQKMDDAITYYLLASQIKPAWGAPYEQLGYAYLNKADYAKAIENFAKFLQVEPNSEKAPTVQAVLDQLKKMK